MRSMRTITMLLAMCICCGCSQQGGEGTTSVTQPSRSDRPLVEVAAGIPEWISNGVFKLTWHNSDASGFSAFATEYSLARPESTESLGGSPGHYCLRDRWLAARSNGFEFVLVAEFREGAEWVSLTNMILFPYEKSAVTHTLVTNTFGIWSTVGEFK